MRFWIRQAAPWALAVVLLVAPAMITLVSQSNGREALGRIEGAIEQVRDSMTFVVESPRQQNYIHYISMIQLTKTLCHPENGEILIQSVLGTDYGGSPIAGETREQLLDRHRAEIAFWEGEGYVECP